MDTFFPHPQPHTFVGERGQAEVTVKVVDVYTAVLEGIRRASGTPDDGVSEPDLEGVDYIAIAQNACVVIEEIVGTFPNIPKEA